MRVANTHILVTNTRVPRREESVTIPRLDLLWMYWPPNNLTNAELISKLIYWRQMNHNLGSSSAGVLNDELRSFHLIAPNQCERTHPREDLLRLYLGMCEKGVQSTQDDSLIPIDQRKWGIHTRVLTRSSQTATPCRSRWRSYCVNNCEHPLSVLVLCVFGTCRAFVVLAEALHTWCPHVDFCSAPVFVSLRALELMSAQFLPLILM